MLPAFISGCQKYLPDTAITFDRFHVTKEINKGMDDVRKNERRGNFDLKGHKYLFLKGNPTISEQSQRDNLMDKYKNLSDAYTLAQFFKDFREFENTEDATGYLAFWCALAENTQLTPFIKASKTIKNHW